MNSCTLKDITKQIYDGKHGGCTAVDGTGLYFISVKDLEPYSINYENAMQISQKEFDEIYNRTNLENGDTIYANTGDTIGKSIYVENNTLTERTAFQKSVAVLKPNEKVDSRFLYYLMKYETPRLRSAASGSGQKNLLLDTMRDFDVEIPDIPRQEYIAHVLGTIDSIAKNNLSVATTCERILKEMFSYWFIQFDFPDMNGKPYKSSGNAMIWNEELHREIPEGWEVKRLGDLILKNTDAIEPDEPTVTMDLSVMPSNSICLFTYNTSENFDTNLYVMKKGDLLFGSIRPYLKKAGIAPYDGTIAGTVHSYRVIKPYYQAYACATLCNDLTFEYAIKNSKGTKMPVIGSDELLDFKVPFCENIIKQFNDYDFTNIISNCVCQNKSLESLRDELLPMLMMGEV